ncbi:hypothetical protein D3C78_573240 [compost metagenome]
MNSEAIASALWGAPEQASPAESMLGSGKAPEPAQEAPKPVAEAIEEPTSAAAAALWGMNADQVPDDQHYPELTGLYDELEHADRLAGEEVDVEAFKASSTALQAFAVDAGMGRQHVGTLMTAAEAAIANPITSAESLAARNEACINSLRGAWGKNFDQNMAHAKAEAARLTRSVPGAAEVLNLGAGSDPALVKVLADAGRARRK